MYGKSLLGGGTQHALTFVFYACMHMHASIFKRVGVNITGFKAIKCVGVSIKINMISGSVVYACLMQSGVYFN